LPLPSGPRQQRPDLCHRWQRTSSHRARNEVPEYFVWIEEKRILTGSRGLCKPCRRATCRIEKALGGPRRGLRGKGLPPPPPPWIENGRRLCRMNSKRKLSRRAPAATACLWDRAQRTKDRKNPRSADQTEFEARGVRGSYHRLRPRYSLSGAFKEIIVSRLAQAAS